MFYYKKDDLYYSSSLPLDDMEEITEQEYNEAINHEPTEEEIRAQKEAMMLQLMKELYPDEYKEG